MKKGTILLNPWVGEENPLQKSCYMGTKGPYFETWYVCNGKIEKSNYHKNDLNLFKVLGYSDSWNNFIKNLKTDLENF